MAHPPPRPQLLDLHHKTRRTEEGKTNSRRCVAFERTQVHARLIRVKIIIRVCLEALGQFESGEGEQGVGELVE